MALIVEDGTAKVDADSYASLAEADTRLDNLGMTTWAPLQDEEKEQALRRATGYMEQQYRPFWAGYRYSIEQALSWPRTCVYVENFEIASDVLPSVIRDACIDLAFKAAAGDLNPDPSIEGGIATKVKVGPIEEESTAPEYSFRFYPAITMMLRPYLKVSGSRVIR